MRRVAFAALAAVLMSLLGAPAAAGAHVDPSKKTHVAHNRKAQDEAVYKLAKARANNRAWRSSTAGAASVAAAQSSPGVYGGINFEGLVGDGSISPSDATGDVGTAAHAGQSRIAEMVNSTGATFVSPVQAPDTKAFFDIAGLKDTDCIFDPQIQWDAHWGRWILAMTAQLSNVPTTCGDEEKNPDVFGTQLIYGISRTNTPSWNVPAHVPNWCVYHINTANLLHDFPKLGHDNNFITIGTNVYSDYGSGDFVSSAIWAIPKFSTGTGGTCAAPKPPKRFGGTAASPLKNTDGTIAFTPVPADTTDSFGRGYIVAAENPGLANATELQMWHLTSNVGVPVLTSDGLITVPAYVVPPSVPQPSTGVQSCNTTGDCLDSSDTRLTQAIAHYDPDAGTETVWTQHTITDQLLGDESVARWYELVPGQTTPRQTGTISDPSLYVFNSAISPSTAGNEAAIFYNVASGDVDGFVSYRARTRNKLTPLGEFSDETILASSTVSDADFTCGVSADPQTADPCRWGDYAAARPDPLHANAIWGWGMLMSSSTAWTTRIAAVTPGCSSVNLDITSTVGTQITVSASGVTGCDTPLYQFRVIAPSGAATVLQAFSSTASVTWDNRSSTPGDYLLEVWAIQSGDSSADGEAIADVPFHIAACTLAGVTPNPSSTPAGTPVSFTATSSGCPDPQYAYWIKSLSGKWYLKRPFSTDPTFDWSSVGFPPGSFAVRVWANRVPSSTHYDTYADTSVTLTGCTSATLTPPSGSASVATAVDFTAAAFGGCDNPAYEFWVLDTVGKWHRMTGFSTTTTWIWTHVGWPKGVYHIRVWANQSGAYTGTYETFGSSTYTLT